MRSAQKAIAHYVGEKPVETLTNHITRSEENDQIKTVQIVRNNPLTQDFMPLGYNRVNIEDRIARASFYDFQCGLNPNFEAEYNKNGKINYEQFVRSTTRTYGTNSNMFVWDDIPELENLPVSGHPNEVAQQYVLYNVQPQWLASTQNTLHISSQAVPTAYSIATSTSKQQDVVYQTPVTQLVTAMSGMSLLQRIKTWLLGGG